MAHFCMKSCQMGWMVALFSHTHKWQRCTKHVIQGDAGKLVNITPT